MTSRDPATSAPRGRGSPASAFPRGGGRGARLGGQPGASRWGRRAGLFAGDPAGPAAHLTRLQPLALDDHLVLDEAAARNLELVQSLHDRGAAGAPLGDRPDSTSMGGAAAPVASPAAPPPSEISAVSAAVAALIEARRSWPLRERLGGIGDLALASRVALGVATPRDLAASARRSARCRAPGARRGCPEPLARVSAPRRWRT